jgi:hypothetical protein
MSRIAVIALTSCVFAAGCGGDGGVSPSGSSVLDSLAGSWGLSASSDLPASCTELTYTITKGADDRSGEVTFNGVCSGIQASGTGKGTLTGSTLNWTAEGTASREGLTCPFSVSQGTAALEGDGVRVTYAGTVCGLAVNGSELLNRK